MASLLFTPLALGQTTVKNRFCFPSVGLLQDADPVTGCPTAARTAHYAGIARGGAGLIVVGITSVQQDARLRPGQFGLWDDAPIGGFRRMTQAIHRHGAVTVVQLHHAGARVQPAVCRDRVAPSALPAFGARAMTLDEIYRLREDFIAAAVRAQKAGFDGVELHAAHGYLLSLFASPLYNHRRDAYGGTPENRVRLQAEIIQGIHAACGGAFIVSSRIGGNEPGFAQGVEIARLLEAAGADSLSAVSYTHLWAALSMLPHDASGIWMPKPKKLRADSAKMALGMPKVKATRAGEMALGKMYFSMMTEFLVPTARALSTYSFSRTEMTLAYSSRAKPGQPMTPMTNTSVPTDGLSTDTSTMFRHMEGMDWNISAKRMMTTSAAPR